MRDINVSFFTGNRDCMVNSDKAKAKGESKRSLFLNHYQIDSEHFPRLILPSPTSRLLVSASKHESENANLQGLMA